MESDSERTPARVRWRDTVHEIIFEAETLRGKGFDVALIVLIALSVVVVMLDSVQGISVDYGRYLSAAEWTFTAIFTVEYLLRIVCVDRPTRYALSFFGIVDLLAIVPTYVSLFSPGSEYLVVIRALRVLRVFRVLKLGQHVREAKVLTEALYASRRKLAIFVYTVMTLVVILGSLMYLIEGEENGFTSIPISVYWAIVTLTTVGFGDITPQTELGRTLSAIIMLLGYAIIAVPTGIVTVSIAEASKQTPISTEVCKSCSREGHEPDAVHCKYCGARL